MITSYVQHDYTIYNMTWLSVPSAEEGPIGYFAIEAGELKRP